MNKKAIIAGVAIGVAALTAAGIIAYRNRSKKAKMKDTAGDYADKFKSKLSSLERKAKKEYAQIVEDGEEFANRAKERATQWANKAGANL
ncbi:hypothetical protein HUK80_16210 [Flavobacterium sp. MAH-1]|uniref:YtxH domain-containing protein n=1 Tax=Flavobacterium agri TaxID=2743471 RepID=A0A7Y8Y4Y7_9FLAO|nr:hypothetical protein [Flavobacterium agri]NUY82451.1 hypothetical protein [Flavobacterium agri]NYA72475.1 hypothetical protein [Flavobacterium agri]